MTSTDADTSTSSSTRATLAGPPRDEDHPELRDMGGAVVCLSLPSVTGGATDPIMDCTQRRDHVAGLPTCETTRA